MTSTPENGSGFYRTLLFILISLFVTVIGGLAVEYLKPQQVYNNPSAVPGATPPPAGMPVSQPTQNQLRAAAIQNLLVKKWNAAETVHLFGDVRVVFTPFGQVVRTYYTQLLGETVTTHPYQVAEDGTLSSDATTNLKLVHVSNDELVLSWNGTVAQYKRAWYWWEIALMVVGGILLLGIYFAGLKAMMKK